MADAHFRSIGAISAFFRYYLAIMALPVTAVGVFVGLLPSFGSLGIVGTVALSLGFIALVISVIGYLVMLYIVNLRLDVVLYARAVNGIRKYFYDNGISDLSYRLRMRVLPQSPTQPVYLENSYFGPVIATFAFFNSAYLVVSLTILTISNVADFSFKAIPLWILGTGFVFVVVHYGSYRLYARHRELGYLKSFIIGVDIDGVLNDHRRQFSRILHEVTGKVLDPNKITTIPLHEDPSQGVTRDDEKAVFNKTEYWTNMPIIDPSAKGPLDKLRNQFKMKIHIFTYRPWPLPPVVRGTEEFEKWLEVAIPLTKHVSPLGIRRYFIPRWLYQKTSILRMKYGRRRFALDPIYVISRAWLNLHGISFDSFTLEKGNEDVSDPRGHSNNRFIISQKKNIRFFVEDDADKANKLAFVSDLVFLLNQPYNTWKTVPDNVVRVDSWEDISKSIKKFI